MQPLSPPLSKSDAHRLLVLHEVVAGAHEALLAGVEDVPNDVLVLSRGLQQLRGRAARVDCEDAGAPFRFLLTQAALTPHARWEFTGTARLAARPHGALVDALVASLGVEVQQPSGAWPLVLTTGALTPPAAFSVSGEESSQFASSLLLGAARLVHEGSRPEVAVRVGGAQTSAGYYSLTVDWVRRAGFSVTEEPRVTTVSGRGHAPSASIPGDWSSLTYLLPLAWRAGLLVAHVDRAAAHPDRAFAAHLEAAGLSLGGEGSGLTAVRGRLERGVTVDASVCPDAVPALVAVALAAPGPSRFTRCSVLRLKESDRLAGVMDLVGRFGGASQLAGDTLTVRPPARAQACEYDGRDDHRLVMAASVAGALLGVTVAIRGTGCVAKSFPSYWREAAKAGALRVEAE